MTVNYWFGDSIGTGGWMVPNAARDCPMGRLNLRLQAAGQPLLSNISVGGLPIHNPQDPNGPNNALPWLQAHQPPDPGILVIALGANDISSHFLASEITGPPANSPLFIDYLKWAAIALDAWARSYFTKVLWQTILPVVDGPLCTEPLPQGLWRDVIATGWSGPMNARGKNFNDWMKAMWPTRVVDVSSALRPDAAGAGDPRLYFDGLHPHQWGSSRIADVFPLSHFLVS